MIRVSGMAGWVNRDFLQLEARNRKNPKEQDKGGADTRSMCFVS